MAEETISDLGDTITIRSGLEEDDIKRLLQESGASDPEANQWIKDAKIKLGEDATPNDMLVWIVQQSSVMNLDLRSQLVENINQDAEVEDALTSVPVLGPDDLSSAHFFQMQNYLNFVVQTFAEDPEIADALNRALERMGVGEDTLELFLRSGSGNALKDPGTIGNILKDKGVSPELVSHWAKTFLPQGESDIFDEVVLAFRQGRSNLPWDDERRDPNNILTPIQEANNSPLMDIRGEDDSIIPGPQTITVSNLIELSFGQTFPPEVEARVRALQRNPEWATWDQPIRSAELEKILKQYQAQNIDWIWETSGLASEFALEKDDPVLINVRESFRKAREDRTQVAKIAEALSWQPSEGPSFGNLMDWFGNTTTKLMRFAADQQRLAGLPLPTRITAQEAVHRLNELDDAQFQRLQLAHFLAGGYGALAANQVRWGDRSDTTIRTQWIQAVGEAATEAKWGNDITINQIFQRAVRRAELERENQSQIDRILDQVKQKNIARQTVTKSDPNTIALAAEQKAKEMFGRTPTPDELRAIVNQVWQGQVAEGARRARIAASEAMRAQADENAMQQAIINQQIAEAEIRSRIISDPNAPDMGQLSPEAAADFGSLAAPNRSIEQPLRTTPDNAETLAQQQIARTRAELDVQLQNAAGSGGGGGVNVVQSFDPNAAIEMYFRRHRAGDIKAKQLFDVMNVFMDRYRN